MTKEFFIAAAAFLILTPAASAQPTGAPSGPPTAPTPDTRDASLAGQFNATLQAGQILASRQVPASNFITFDSASAGQGLRTPNPSTGTYNGPARQTYGAPGSTPYTGAASSSTGGVYAPGAVPYTGPGR